jgi:DNA-binding NarL/FixJ family response regulator
MAGVAAADNRPGAEYVRQLLENSPEFRQGLKRAQKLLRDTGEAHRALTSMFAGIHAAIHAEHAAAVEGVREQERADYGESLPDAGDIEGWMRLASRFGVSAERLLAGEWTPAALAPIIEGGLLGLRDPKKSGRPIDQKVAKRREEVARLTDDGMTQGEIAAELKIPIDTVKDDRAAVKSGGKYIPPQTSKRKK